MWLLGPGLTTMVDIIDDDDAVRESTRALLESYGYEVHDHASAEQFLKDSNTKPDCLLVDQHMPGMTGLDLLEHLRAQGDTTPALMMTGRSDPTLGPRAARIGVKLLHKPIPEDQLVLWIEQARRPGA
jgi:two-component system, LuxR family, response regulator FixJ